MPLRNSVENAKSRYTQGGVTERYPRRLGWWERNLDLLTKHSDDILITLDNKYHLRPDTLAADFLGSASLMWMVLEYNNIVDINEEFLAGKQVRLPTPGRAVTSLLGSRTGGVRVTSTTSS